MRDLTLNKWILVLFAVFLPLTANAVGLGRLNVLSALGQPFSAEVELVSPSKEELATLTVQLGTPDAYRQANLQYGPALPSLRFSIETRAGGQAYVKVISSRPVSEPFIDLLLELNWASGRLVREYTALLDPPGIAPAPAPVAPIAVPQVQPAPPAARIEPVPAPAVAPAPAPVAPGTYGPIQRGETLGKIAAELKPEGISLEQMMIGLQRSNPDAFIRNNVNLVKAGKILKVPEKEELAAISQAEATKEYRAQVTDWNAYRQRLADSAGTALETRTAASGKITTTVEDQGGTGPKDVVRLSKGEPPGTAADGKPRSAAERLRILQEEAVAREKALAEANDRIVHLEKTIKDMQKLVELKGGAAVPKPAAKPAVKPEPAPKPKPEVAAESKPAPAEPKKEESAPTAVKKEEPAAAPAVKPAEPTEAKPAPKPKPKPKVVAPPPPPPEPELIDVVMDNLPLVGGGLAVVLIGAGYAVMRRRRSRAAAEPAEKAAPSLAARPEPAGEEEGAPSAEAPAATSQEVDPLAEAEVYMAYGRDAQAEEILKEAMARDPSRQDVQLKLLEIYSARKDKKAFGTLAKGLNSLTGGQGDHWIKAAAMGYALDPEDALYAAGKDVVAAQPAPGPTTTDFDFNLDASAPETDVSLEPGAPETETMVGTDTMRQPPEGAEHELPAGPLTSTDISFEIPETPEPAAADIALDVDAGAKAPEAPESSGIDFSVELPKLEDDTPTASMPAEAEQKQEDGGLDFKLDLGDINLESEEPTTPGAGSDAGAEKDAHWYDVQTKFDLAKAYQEMGDKDGAREILQEVIKEGDAEQQAQAKQLLDTLG